MPATKRSHIQLLCSGGSMSSSRRGAKFTSSHGNASRGCVRDFDRVGWQRGMISIGSEFMCWGVRREDRDDYVPQHKYVTFLTQVFEPICRLRRSGSRLLLISRPWSIGLFKVERAMCSSYLSMQLRSLRPLVWPHLDVRSISVQNYSLPYLLFQATLLDFRYGATCSCTVSMYS